MEDLCSAGKPVLRSPIWRGYGAPMATAPAVELAPGAWRIPTLPGDLVSSFAFVDPDGQVTLVDCGLAKAPPRIVAGLAAMGKQPGDVTRILLTHAHVDHAGGAAEMSSLTGARVSVHGDDAAYLSSGQPSPVGGGTRLGRLLARMPGGNGFSPVEGARTLVDGEVLEVGGGLRVVHTPGHSPGHVSFLHEPSRVLVTGDALFNWTWVGGLRYSPRSLCSDVRLSQRSAHALGELDYDVAAFTHGPEIRDGARQRVRGYLAAHPPA